MSRTALAVLLLCAAALAGSPLHPEIALLDKDGTNVLESGEPVSTTATCGGCHDVEYIESHSYHSAVGSDEMWEPGEGAGAWPWDVSPGLFGRWDPIRYWLPDLGTEAGRETWIRTKSFRHVGGGPARGRVEMNCFLCHLPRPGLVNSASSILGGRYEWAATATLNRTGLVDFDRNSGWSCQTDRFTEDGKAPREALRIGDPLSSNCSICHMVAHEGTDPFAWPTLLPERDTILTGQVWSAQHISDSAMNLSRKGELTRPWDVHAARLVKCSQCHPSLNNPLSFAEAKATKPRHLKHDARRLRIGEYLHKPSHHFAKGESAIGNVANCLDATMRRCEDCHDAYAVHERWLPNTRRHLESMLCETCHIPRIHAPAVRQVDWTVLTPEGKPRIEHRGTAEQPPGPASWITGYEPVILPRRQKDGRVRLGPHNLVTVWFWTGGDPERPVPFKKLPVATTGDGILDTEEEVAAAKAELEAAGVKNPRIRGLIQPVSIHHDVVAGAFATRDCSACHTSDSRLTRPFLLSSYAPHGVEAELVGDTNVTLPGRFFRRDPGWRYFEPVPSAAGRYVIGHDRAGWIDVLGALLVIGTIFGVGAHATGRWLAGRRRGRAS